MEQRIYHGNIDLNGLADYLVNMAGQFSRRYTAQKIGQGDHLMVQIGRMSSRGYMRHAIGVSISKLADGIGVAVGQANWLDPSIGGTLVGAIFWPPLLLFPLARGIRGYQMYQDIWDAIDMYCTQAGASIGQTTTSHAVYCQHCGAVNEEDAQVCSICGSPLPASPPVYTAQPTGQGQAAQSMSQPAQSYSSNEQVACPQCGHIVPAANFCNNCGASLR
ncbi:MAG: zinc ribbon domain-containing protein [Chloroflexota bacterium]|nr:zinc ribbon domain-containing protein [Chloroflexota bacterium]